MREEETETHTDRYSEERDTHTQNVREEETETHTDRYSEERESSQNMQ